LIEQGLMSHQTHNRSYRGRRLLRPTASKRSGTILVERKGMDKKKKIGKAKERKEEE